MKKNTLVILAVLGIGGYFAYKSGIFGKKDQARLTDEETPEETTATDKTETTKETIYAEPGKVNEAITTAKQIVKDVKDAVVTIKTSTGKKIRVGRKSKLKKTAKKTRKPSAKYRRLAKKGKAPSREQLTSMFLPK